MSCFIVNNETINGILAFSERADGKSEGLYIGIKPLIKGGGSSEYFTKCRDELGQKMLDMNLAAYAERYDEPISIQPFDFEYIKTPSPEEAVKMIDCLLYQCCEGLIPRDWKLYKRLEQFRDQITRAVVRYSPKYEVADWK